ncbi:MAG: hypothetical protein HYR76_08675 [Ignavibacteria bacterium]|nr:hypothetical protein [Ignavibacteria bacterium]
MGAKKYKTEHPLTILIADDYATNLKLLKAQLEEEKFHVLSATNGVEAGQVLFSV